MAKDIIEIRGNISSYIGVIEKLRAEREEREKAEREERWRLEREEREKKESEWKLAHPVLDKYTFMSYSNYETYSWKGEYCNIHFYEFSNLQSNPRIFPYTIEFFRFLDRCGIMPTQEEVDKFRYGCGKHIICKPGSTNIIIGDSYNDMKEQFESYVLTSKILSEV